MKIRNGFVSNSSSASFVITAKCTLEELNKLVDTTTMSKNVGDERDPEAWSLAFGTGYTIREDSLGNTIIYGWTVMYNDDESFGPGFKIIQDVLWANNIPCRVEIIDEG